ncbi:MAG: DUF6502 family protein [Oceanococcaceae bacterium]
MTDLTAHLHRALARILRPLARFCIAHGIAAAQFHELVKQAFVCAAQDAQTQAGERPTKARVAVMSGLTRVEVSRLWQAAGDGVSDAQDRVNYGQRLVSAWLREPDFCSDQGTPRALPLSGGAADFAELVRRYGANMPARAALDELESRGIVQVADEMVRLVSRSYIPAGLNPEKVLLLGIDGAALLGTLEHNLRPGTTPRFERKVSFRHLSAAGRQLLHQEGSVAGQELLEALDARLAPLAHDEPSAGTRHAGLGIFIFEEDDLPPADAHTPETGNDG